MKKVRRLWPLAMAVLMSTAATAQENGKVETTIAADVVNQYIWRGLDAGNVSLQPTLGVAWKGLSLTAWGSVGLTESSDTKEFDLTLCYTTGGLNVGITDYWFSTGQDLISATSSMMPTARIMCLKPTSATTLAW